MSETQNDEPQTIEEFARRHKKLVERLSKLSAESMALACTERLWATHGDTEEMRMWRPWDLVTLLQLCLRHGRYSVSGEPVTRDTLAHLLNALKDMEHPRRQVGVLRIVRQVAHEQFLWQRPLDKITLGRIESQFGALEEKNKLATLFRERVGLSFSDYATLTWALWTGVRRGVEQAVFDKRWFANLGLADRDLDAFLAAISIPLKDAQQWLARRRPPPRDAHLELFEPVHLARRPVIAIGSRYLLLSPTLLEMHLTRLDYPCVEADPQVAGEAAGHLQEAYVAGCLAPLHPVTEQRIQNDGYDGKVADFLVGTSTSFVLIESKAIDPHPKLRVDPSLADHGDYAKKLRDAFKQCVETARFLRSKGDSRRPFAWVITRGDFFHMSGLPLWDELLRGHLDEGVIAPTDFFLMSIYEFERLVAMHPSADALLSFFEAAAVTQASMATATFQLASGLISEDSVTLRHQQSALERLGDRLAARLGPRPGRGVHDEHP